MQILIIFITVVIVLNELIYLLKKWQLLIILIFSHKSNRIIIPLHTRV
jgi:hypothetical protein